MLKDGKLFGKINIIDLAALIIVVILIFVAAVKFFPNKETIDMGESKEVYVTIICKAVSEEACDALKEGDKLVAKGSFTTGEIVSVNKTSSIVYTSDSEGRIVAAEHPVYKDAVITIKDTAKINTPILNCAGQEIRIGYNFIVKTQLVEINGEITEIKIAN